MDSDLIETCRKFNMFNPGYCRYCGIPVKNKEMPCWSCNEERQMAHTEQGQRPAVQMAKWSTDQSQGSNRTFEPEMIQRLNVADRQHATISEDNTTYQPGVELEARPRPRLRQFMKEDEIKSATSSCEPREGRSSFEPDLMLEDQIKHPTAWLKPPPLSRGLRSLTKSAHATYVDRLEASRKQIEEYLQEMKESGTVRSLKISRGKDVLCQIGLWRAELDALCPDTQISQETPSAEERPLTAMFESGWLRPKYSLGDIRQKRFINCGEVCDICKDAGKPLHEIDHPTWTCGLFTEIYYFWAGETLDPILWCERCSSVKKKNKFAPYHQTNEHGMTMWYDHPETEESELGDLARWYHPFPQERCLDFVPGTSEEMAHKMRQRQDKQDRAARRRAQQKRVKAESARRTRRQRDEQHSEARYAGEDLLRDSDEDLLRDSDEDLLRDSDEDLLLQETTKVDRQIEDEFEETLVSENEAHSYRSPPKPKLRGPGRKSREQFEEAKPSRYAPSDAPRKGTFAKGKANKKTKGRARDRDSD